MLTRPDTKLAKIFNRLTDLPSLPAVVNRLMQLREDEATVKEFAELVSADQGLAAKVLKLVNSAFYSLRAPVSSLSLACSLLGVRTIKSLVLSVSVMQLLKRRCQGFDPIRFWRNALATALAGRSICKRVSQINPEEIYVAGLLHGSGAALFVQFFPREYEKVLADAKDGKKTLLELEEEEFGAGHPEAGGRLAAHWRLAPFISAAIWHHRALPEMRPADLEPEHAQATDLIRLADFWARREGFWFLESETIDPSEPAQVPGWIPLDESALREAIGDIATAVSSMEGFLQQAVSAGGGPAR